MMLRAVLSVLYPQTCPMCGGYVECTREQRTLYKGSMVCEACIDSLSRTEQAVMRENSTETTLWGTCKSTAAARKTLHLERAAAFLFFEKEHPIQRAIHLMKYADQPEIGYQLAREAAKEFLHSDFFDEIDVIMPVPLHKNRLRSRGFNQSEYIARGLSEMSGIPMDNMHLTRQRDTPKQAQITHLSPTLATSKGDTTEKITGRDLRKANVDGAFAINHPEQMYHKHILLVDDLITTGETVRACLKAMRAFRGARFSVFALCKAK